MRSYKILSGFNRFPMAKNLGNKKKFAQIGQCIREISQKPFSGTQGGSGAQKRVKECPKKKGASKFGFSAEKWVGLANKINLGTKFARDLYFLHKHTYYSASLPVIEVVVVILNRNSTSSSRSTSTDSNCYCCPRCRSHRRHLGCLQKKQNHQRNLRQYE